MTMALLQRLALAAGRALSRAADWLLARGVEGQPTPAETPVAVTQEADPEGGPPAHWLATVRARAPWLLARDRLVMRHAMHRRPPVVPCSRYRQRQMDPGTLGTRLRQSLIPARQELERQPQGSNLRYRRDRVIRRPRFPRREPRRGNQRQPRPCPRR